MHLLYTHKKTEEKKRATRMGENGSTKIPRASLLYFAKSICSFIAN